MTPMTPFCLVLCTCPDETVAETIARQAVESELAACVNLLPGVRSFYRWQGQVQQDSECQLVLKTEVQSEPELKSLVHRLHPYDVPEWLVLPVSGGSEPYLDWIKSSLR